MKDSQSTPPDAGMPPHPTARRLIERALIVERPGQEAPFYWRMSEAGPCQGDYADQSIPEDTKERFALIGRMIGASLRAQALVLVTEAWTYIPKRRTGESDEQLRARAEDVLQTGVSRHPEREERLFAVAEWIEDGTIHRTHALWEIERTPGKARVGAMVSCDRDAGQPIGRLAQWLCPVQPVPDALARTAQAFLNRCGIAGVSGQR